MHQPILKNTENSTFGVFKSGEKYMVLTLDVYTIIFEYCYPNFSLKHLNVIDYMNLIISIGGTIYITVHDVEERNSTKPMLVIGEVPC